MSRLAIPRSRPSTLHAVFAGLVLLQAGFLNSLSGANPDEPFTMMVTAAQVAPFIVLALLLWPVQALLMVPLLVVVPGSFFGFTSAEWLLLATLVVTTLLALASGTILRRPSAVEWIYAGYVLWAAVTISQAVEVRDAILGLKRIVVLFLAFQTGMHVLGADRARNCVRILAALAPVVAIELFVVILSSGIPLAFLLTRSGALTNLGWGYSNYVAAVAALSVAAAIPLSLYGRPGERILGIASLLAGAFVATATLSRGGTLAIVVGLLVATAVEARRRLLLAVCIMAAIVSAYLLSPLGRAGLERFVAPKEFASIGVRVLFYQETFRITMEHPVMGVGPDQIPNHSAYYLDRNPHNFLLKNSADLGFPGLALYVAVLCLLARSARHLFIVARDSAERILALAYLLILTVALTTALYEPALEGSAYGILFWLTSGALYARSEHFPRLQTAR